MRHKLQEQKGNEAGREHILACLSSAPSNTKIIRTAAHMAEAFNGSFTALFVETPDFQAFSLEDKQRLSENRSLAQQLGAATEVVYGEDVAYQIAEFARLSGITRIVLGRSAVTRRHLWGKPTLTEQLIAYAPEIDIHIIPDRSNGSSYRPKKARNNSLASFFSNSMKSLGILAGATLLCLLFDHLGFTDANMIMVYILGVLLTSIVTEKLIYSQISSVASIFIFNYFFTQPRFSLAAYGTGYPVTFVVMFLTASITGTFTIRYKEQAKQSARVAYRTKVLFDTEQLLSKAKNKDEILRACARQLVKLLDRTILVFDGDNGQLSAPRIFCSEEHGPAVPPEQRELEAAKWVLENNESAGATTDLWPNAKYLYLALHVNERIYGVVGIEAEREPLEMSEYGILLSILGECALALENEKNRRDKEAAAIFAESEQLRANLLRSISHDLRTPLTSISGNASNLLGNGEHFDEETKRDIYRDIYNDSIWLISLVENLLSATRLEEGRMNLRMTTELLSDIVEEALRHNQRKAAEHQLSMDCCEELLLVRADARLILQVLVNLIDNAIKYTEPASSIVVKTRRKGDMAEVLVSDNGLGIPDEEKGKIFDKFYCGPNMVADNRRSIGLGLYLCKAIVEAHGGSISVEDNHPQGAVFRFTLKLEEVSLHE